MKTGVANKIQALERTNFGGFTISHFERDSCAVAQGKGRKDDAEEYEGMSPLVDPTDSENEEANVNRDMTNAEDEEMSEEEDQSENED